MASNNLSYFRRISLPFGVYTSFINALSILYTDEEKTELELLCSMRFKKIKIKNLIILYVYLSSSSDVNDQYYVTVS